MAGDIPDEVWLCGDRIMIGPRGTVFERDRCPPDAPDGGLRAHVHVPAANTRHCGPLCTDRGTDHVHHVPEQDITPAQVQHGLEADIRGGLREERALYRKYRGYGYDRHAIRKWLNRLKHET